MYESICIHVYIYVYARQACKQWKVEIHEDHEDGAQLAAGLWPKEANGNGYAASDNELWKDIDSL